jgi:hypothetical protein
LRDVELGRYIVLAELLFNPYAADVLHDKCRGGIVRFRHNVYRYSAAVGCRLCEHSIMKRILAMYSFNNFFFSRAYAFAIPGYAGLNWLTV